MSAAQSLPLISIERYLSDERDREVRHEYREGRVYAMAGATNNHNRVARNFVGTLFGRLRGGSCEVFGSDVKVRIQTSGKKRFYYPDATVVCEPNGPGDTFQDRPVVVLEVFSPATRRLDEGEKLEAYLVLPSVRVVLLVDPDRYEVTVYRREGSSGSFTAEFYTDAAAVIALPEILTELSLADLYERVVFDV